MLGDLRLVLLNILLHCISSGRHIDYCTKAFSHEISFALLQLAKKINLTQKLLFFCHSVFFYLPAVKLSFERKYIKLEGFAFR